MVLLSLRANAMQGLAHIRTTESRSNTRIGCRTRGDSGGGAVEQSPIQNINISAASHQPRTAGKYSLQSRSILFCSVWTRRLVYCSRSRLLYNSEYRISGLVQSGCWILPCFMNEETLLQERKCIIISKQFDSPC